MASERRLVDANVLEEMVKISDKPAWMVVRDAPTVDAVEVVHGRWIHTAIEDDNWGGTFHTWTCSNCNFSTGHNPNGTNYCPNCGAKMDGERKDK